VPPHANLVALRGLAFGEGSAGSDDDCGLYLVLEYCVHDLGALLDALPVPFSEAAAKGLARQTLRGLAHLHAHGCSLFSLLFLFR
jgi:serine/threonine protein kinase